MSEQELRDRIQRLEKQLQELRNPAGLVSTPGLLQLYESLYVQGNLNVGGTLNVGAMTKTGSNMVSNLNADMIDGYHAGNGAGVVAVSNGGLCTSLNADMLDGYHAPDPVATYTPTWGSSGTQPVLNNGTLDGKWFSLGKLTVVQVSLVMGNATTYGTGTYYITLPATPSIISVAAAYALDAGTSHYRMIARCTPVNNQVTFSLDTGSNVTNTYPFTWAVNDQLQFAMVYFAA